MIIVKLKGGMGNQMFQYALGRHLAIKHKTSLKLDLTFLLDRTPRKDFVFRDYDLDIFTLTVDVATPKNLKPFREFRIPQLTKAYNILPRLLKRPHVIVEPHFHFSEAILSAPDNVYLDGYWQSEHYFRDVEDVIRKDFTFKDALDEKGSRMAQAINAEPGAVCLNVRRGDFVTLKKAADFHGSVGVDYYQKAIDLLVQRGVQPHLFIFSDDIEWCTEHLKFDHPTTFVTGEYAGKKFEQYLHLMTLCKHYIIPNSTFAWWGAWLSKHSDKIVIAPKRWFMDPTINTTDIIPAGWIRI